MKEYLIKTSTSKKVIVWLNRWQDASVFYPDAVEVYDLADKTTYRPEGRNA